MNWFAAYTSPRAEKKAYAGLISKGINAYLPLQRTLRQWSDRKKWVEEPLFRSYLFVNVSQKSYFDVLNTPGIARYVTFEGKAVPIPPKQIDAIRFYLEETDHVATGEPLTEVRGKSGQGSLPPGSPVEVMRGPLRGLKGQIVDHQGHKRVRIEIEALGQFLNLNIAVKDLRIIK